MNEACHQTAGIFPQTDSMLSKQDGGTKAWAQAKHTRSASSWSAWTRHPLWCAFSTSHHPDGLRVISVAGLQWAAPDSYLRQACAPYSHRGAFVW